MHRNARLAASRAGPAVAARTGDDGRAGRGQTRQLRVRQLDAVHGEQPSFTRPSRSRYSTGRTPAAARHPSTPPASRAARATAPCRPAETAPPPRDSPRCTLRAVPWSVRPIARKSAATRNTAHAARRQGAATRYGVSCISRSSASATTAAGSATRNPSSSWKIAADKSLSASDVVGRERIRDVSDQRRAGHAHLAIASAIGSGGSSALRRCSAISRIDPRRHRLGRRDLPAHPGQLEMRVRVDEAGQDRPTLQPCPSPTAQPRGVRTGSS